MLLDAVSPQLSPAEDRQPCVVLDRFASVLWPARCAGCNVPVAEGTSFCARCEISSIPLDHCCPGCAMPMSRGPCCPGCLRRPFPFSRAFAALAYGGSLTQALLRFKHGGHRHVARPLAHFLAPLLDRATAHGAELACPVPLHATRLRQRGFNQALDLLLAARGIAAARPAMAVVRDALLRTIDTPNLGHGSPAQRQRLVANAFATRRPCQVAGKRVLVVDDVMTTGATLAECARTLLAAGASEVMVAALARAV